MLQLAIGAAMGARVMCASLQAAAGQGSRAIRLRAGSHGSSYSLGCTPPHRLSVSSHEDGLAMLSKVLSLKPRRVPGCQPAA